MLLNWIKSESTQYPELLDITSSKKVVYLRKNVEEVIKHDEVTSEEITFYEYDECKLTKEEYAEYLRENEEKEIRQQRADIDYIALCVGVNIFD